MLKLKLQNLGHLMQRADSFERARCWQRLKAEGKRDDIGWDGWMDMGLSIFTGLLWGNWPKPMEKKPPCALMAKTKGQYVVVVQSLSCVWLFVTPWTAACQASLSFAISQNFLKKFSHQVDDIIQLSHPLSPSLDKWVTEEVWDTRLAPKLDVDCGIFIFTGKYVYFIRPNIWIAWTLPSVLDNIHHWTRGQSWMIPAVQVAIGLSIPS